jgi:hypothetical protein
MSEKAPIYGKPQTTSNPAVVTAQFIKPIKREHLELLVSALKLDAFRRAIPAGKPLPDHPILIRFTHQLVERDEELRVSASCVRMKMKMVPCPMCSIGATAHCTICGGTREVWVRDGSEQEI